MHECSGAGLYGPDLSEWPARMVAVISTIENERIKVSNQEFEAQQDEE